VAVSFIGVSEIEIEVAKRPVQPSARPIISWMICGAGWW